MGQPSSTRRASENVTLTRCSSKCTACAAAAAEAPVFYHLHRVDGAGGTIMTMLYAMAFAASRGMHYGGALAGCPAGNLCHRHVLHGINVDSVISLLLGTSGY